MKLQNAIQKLLDDLQTLTPKIGVEFVRGQEFDVKQNGLNDDTASARRFYNLGLGEQSAEVLANKRELIVRDQSLVDATTDPYPARSAIALWNIGTTLLSDLNSMATRPNLIAHTSFFLQNLRYIDRATWVPKVVDARSYEVGKVYRDFISKLALMDPEELLKEIPGLSSFAKAEDLTQQLASYQRIIQSNLDDYEDLLPERLAQSQPLAEQAAEKLVRYQNLKPELQRFVSHENVLQTSESTLGESSQYSPDRSYAEKLQQTQADIAENLGPNWRGEVKDKLTQLQGLKVPDSWVRYNIAAEYFYLQGHYLEDLKLLERFEVSAAHQASYAKDENILSRFNNVNLHLDVLQYLADTQAELEKNFPALEVAGLSRENEITALKTKLQALKAWQFASPGPPADFTDYQRQETQRGLASLRTHYQSRAASQIEVHNARLDTLYAEELKAAKENMGKTLTLKKEFEQELQVCDRDLAALNSRKEKLTVQQQKNAIDIEQSQSDYTNASQRIQQDISELNATKERLSAWQQQLQGVKPKVVEPLDFAALAKTLDWSAATQQEKLSKYPSFFGNLFSTPETRFMDDAAARLADLTKGLSDVEKLLAEQAALLKALNETKDAKIKEFGAQLEDQAQQAKGLAQEFSKATKRKERVETQITALDQQYRELAFKREVMSINADLEKLSAALEADKGIKVLPLKYVDYPNDPAQREGWQNNEVSDLVRRYGDIQLYRYEQEIKSKVADPLEENQQALAALQQRFETAKKEYQQNTATPPELIKTIKDRLAVNEFMKGIHQETLAAGRELGERLVRDQQQYQADHKMMNLYKIFEPLATQYLADRHEKFWFRDWMEAKAAALFSCWTWEPSQQKRETYITELKDEFKASLESRNYGTLLDKIDEGLRELPSRTTDERDPEYNNTLHSLLHRLEESVYTENPELRVQRAQAMANQ